MAQRELHVIHLLIRKMQGAKVHYLLYPHDKWKGPAGQAFLVLPTKKAVSSDGEFEPFERGTSVDDFVDAVMREDFHLRNDRDYALEEELDVVEVPGVMSPTRGHETDYHVYPIDVWVHPGQRGAVCQEVHGEWLTADQAIAHARISPTAKAVFEQLPTKLDALRSELRVREKERAEDKAANAALRRRVDALNTVLTSVPDKPSMDAAALKWFNKNKRGVRHLQKADLNEILDLGNRAFNLRVADPYLRYQLQGQGFTWSFFTHKDRQDIHVHGAPVVEIYGILEGEMEIWWKPYYDRGASAWNHRILKAGDWAEVDPLQCHIVHWLGEGKGIVFKAGPGPLAGVGRIGVQGKTPCDNCPCIKPGAVNDLAQRLGSRKT